MKEYIEREAAIAEIMGDPSEVRYPVYYAEMLKVLPAADVRPVVLCRDCEYAYDDVGGLSCSHGVCVDCIVREDFFCADGKVADKGDET